MYVFICYHRIHDLRRDIQARIGSRTNIISPVVDNYGGETFLSEEVAMNILQDCKKAFDRCQLVSVFSCEECYAYFYLVCNEIFGPDIKNIFIISFQESRRSLFKKIACNLNIHNFCINDISHFIQF